MVVVLDKCNSEVGVKVTVRAIVDGGRGIDQVMFRARDQTEALQVLAGKCSSEVQSRIHEHVREMWESERHTAASAMVGG